MDTPRTPSAPENGAELDRLRAADPAADSQPDAATLSAAVTARVDESAKGTVDDDLGVRRRRRGVRFAAAAAALLAVGGAGYGLRMVTAPDSAAPPISLAVNSGVDRNGATSESVRDTQSSASEQAVYNGNLVFRGEPAGSGGASPAWAFDAAGVFTKETLAKHAKALGVTGEVRSDYGSFTAGAGGNSGPTASLSPDGTASFSYYDPAKDPWSCPDLNTVEPLPAAPDAKDSVGSASGTASDAVECSQKRGPAPSKDSAVATAKETLSRLGMDPGAFEYQADKSEAATTVTAWSVLDGQRIGITWDVTVVADGVSSIYGGLAPAVALGDYDVISPADAVKRLNDPRFGAQMSYFPEPYVDLGEPADPTVPPTAKAGAKVTWPVTEVTITKARLGAAMQYLPSGAAVAVPTYELSDAAGTTWSVIAVVDSQLDFASK